MGDSRRFDLFGEFLSKHFPHDVNIADVAGGKGYLRLAMREHGFVDGRIDTYDPMRRKNMVILKKNERHIQDLFDLNKSNNYQLVVGMHPDEASDVIVQSKSEYFAIVPCCIRPGIEAYFDKHKTENWLNHLERLANKSGFRKVERAYLKFHGMNTVLFGKR